MIGVRALVVLAGLGLALAISTAILGDQAPTVLPSASPSPLAPFNSYVAGVGVIEASTENIAIGTPVSGIVIQLFVRLGDWVKTGDPLFKIDDRDLHGQLLPAEAKVKEVAANLEKTSNLFKVIEGLKVGSSVSAVEAENRRFDVAINEADLALAKAQVDQIKIEIERRTIRAPVTGRILQLKTRLGEFAQSGGGGLPLMLLGDDSRLHVRAEIDEHDAWRVQPNAEAIAFVRGNPELKAPLLFERFEPMVIPKESLTGESSERTDTRVLQVIYSFDPAVLRVFVGQQVDVFVRASPIAVIESQPPKLS